MRVCNCCGKLLGDAYVAERLDAKEKFCSVVCFRRYHAYLKANAIKRAKMIG